MAPLTRVLISNRGEIAIRIARAASGIGIESVGVYPAVDALSLHTRHTTRSQQIGGAAAAGDPVSAYLDAEELVRVAVENGCDCIHPGYGFLAENADFAKRCVSAGLTFIGPSSETLALFGDKLRAKRLAESLKIPTVPGSDHALESAMDAESVASELGYPVMLKARAGGGGRGMRRVDSASELASSFERCQSEAQAAFGDAAILIEKCIERPRHIEVQILADSSGDVVHLHERDCSVQLRNQKVVEIAPASGLDPNLRDRILRDAIALVQEASFVNAGTVEFLVVPESDDYYFIECNPRIQVEHTVTEEVTGIDLVDAQFRIAAGESLASLGIGSQADVPTPRGFSIQARVVVQGAGTITGYKEPSGAGIRVDACGYLGYSPPPQFDPLLAKLIVTSRKAGPFDAVAARMLAALEEFHIAGLPTNLSQLRAIFESSEFRSGEARTSLLAERPELAAGEAAGNTAPSSAGRPGATPDKASTSTSALALLEERSQILLGAPRAGANQMPGMQSAVSLRVDAGQLGVVCPLAASVVESQIAEGETVVAGQTLLIVSAMKMETAVTAPCAGTISAAQSLSVGDPVAAGQVVAVVVPAEVEAAGVASSSQDPVGPSRDSWASVLGQVDTLRDLAVARMAPGSDDPGVVRQRSRGKLTCRERIALLLDEGSFREVGSVAGFATFDDEGNPVDFTPANHVGGWGKLDARATIVCADDFTSRGGHSDGAIGTKSVYLDRLSVEMRVPSIRLLDGSSGGGSVATMVPKQQQSGESGAKESRGAIKSGRPRVTGGGGSYLPGHLGSVIYAGQLSQVPVVNMLLGSVVGLGAAKAVLGHFSVMVRDMAQLFVAGPPVVSHAMGYDITKEELGGWHIHCTNGSVDNLAESEEDAAAQVKQFLSYLPSSVYEAPPVEENPSDPFNRVEEELLDLIPRKRTTTFDIRRAIRLMADVDSFFEVGTHWGTDQVTGFVRFAGHPIGIVASDSRHTNGGAMTADGCDKLRRHLDVCDLFHVPVLNLIDNPGFAVGLEHEIASTIRKGGEWMVAYAQVQVPIFSVLMRRSFGVAGNNFATPNSRASMRVAWPAADVGGIPPEGGIEAAYKRQLAEAEDPTALRAEIEARIEGARGPLGPLSKFQIEEMVDPRQTRRLICEWVELAYRVVRDPALLVPRGLQFRP